LATCESCGKEIKPGAWNCGFCGAPVKAASASASGGTADAPPDPYGYAPGYEPRPAAAAPTAKAGTSRALLVAIIVAAIAIAAVVAVWFFALRGPSTNGDEFLGTWNASDESIGQVMIARTGDDFKVTLTGSKASQKVTVPAHLDGDELVITTDDFATIAGKENAEAFKETLEAIAGEFRIVFAGIDPTHLEMRVEGSKVDDDADSTETLVKASP